MQFMASNTSSFNGYNNWWIIGLICIPYKDIKNELAELPQNSKNPDWFFQVSTTPYSESNLKANPTYTVYPNYFF